MKVKEFDFNLPEELIAQRPCEPRGNSRMMVVNRKHESIECRYFRDIPDYLDTDDVLILNDSKVIPARLIGSKPTGGMIEILLLSNKKTDSPRSHTWEVLLRPAKRVKAGTVIVFDKHSRAEVIERTSEKKWILDFKTDRTFESFLDQYGRAPLPPYIKRNRTTEKDFQDLLRYQTVYAKMPGSVAAPTAGLHFSETILKEITSQGIRIAPITLHVGYGTFLPVETEYVEDHKMEEEYFDIGKETARLINEAQRVVAVGTTATRVLETVTDKEGVIRHFAGHTNLFIYPGYQFKKVDRLLTNFHLPKSSLFLLVCAFAGKELIMKAYEKAIEEKFRFYSYGDCMLIL
ncbi:MAG: tRNA preQ1(34) S-adenosylmethionine ribosyltransferase-isomerase QueA [Deltaproteobacteria bacterium]|nr:tRNA preQ1(34) S-adenosylmethionine ribosyltransferase-isomerase QueA [Deltaproteobacteria bacterium]